MKCEYHGHDADSPGGSHHKVYFAKKDGICWSWWCQTCIEKTGLPENVKVDARLRDKSFHCVPIQGLDRPRGLDRPLDYDWWYTMPKEQKLRYMAYLKEEGLC